MTKLHRPKRQIDDVELKAHLKEQIAFLKTSAAAYDNGMTGEAKRLALTIRVLLHETKQSKSLLKQLKMDDLKFISTGMPYDKNNLATHMSLLAVRLDPTGAKYVPLLGELPISREMTFGEWWNEIVFTDQAGNLLSRKELVLTAANQDGGGHVDPALDEVYDKLVRDNSLSWFVGKNGKSEAMGDPTKAAIRQIAYEVLAVLAASQVKN
jgi:hypothetical protein